MDWQNAKYVTIINLFLLVVVITSAAKARFNGMAKREANSLMNRISVREKVITPDQISILPAPVQRWMQKSNVLNRSLPTTYRIRQRGTLRTKPTSRWMSFQADQYFSIDPPAFVWHAHIRLNALLRIGGRDRYENGQGHMLIKPLYLFTAANGSGKEVDQGTLLRFLAEMAWFPQAAVSRYLTWEGIDDNHARVTMQYGGIAATGTFSFNTDGLVSGFQARRYGEFGGIYRKENWSVAIVAHQDFNDIPTGHLTELTWKLSEGDFTWLKMEITDIQPLGQMPASETL